MLDETPLQIRIWRLTPLIWGVLTICIIMAMGLFYDGLELMVEWWITREEYGHGFMIPFISGFLIWQKKDKLELLQFTKSWSGFIVVLIGMALYFVGEISSIYTVLQYAFLITLYGIVLSAIGYRSFKVIMAPLFMLFFMLPLPNFIFNDLSAELQLISSEIGVAVIRLFDISVYLEGNVIDLGVYKLQVVEACSGLNYLFPLMTLGFIAAYFFTGSIWKKAIIFLSTIPITILMNSFRIGIIGVTVEYWGPEMAEGVLHDFEGWVVFMSCTAILIFEMWILAHFGKNKMPLREAFGMDFPEDSPKEAQVENQKLSNILIASVAVLIATLITSTFLENREEIIPDRKSFNVLPLSLSEWTGKQEVLEKIYIDKLKLTDYALVNYRIDDQIPVGFYSAYYESQRKESTTHSPRSCIPGGGWRIFSHDIIALEDITISSQPLKVNRLLIVKNEVKQLVYYWFKQRQRVVTNEQMIKWYFFIDSIQKKRTDGALIRFTTSVPKGASVEDADKRLKALISEMSTILPEYIPD
ncbi:MAG: VPLPA-CTERM-specific exosortase XrtD [Pseudomonadota bacterium]